MDLNRHFQHPSLPETKDLESELAELSTTTKPKDPEDKVIQSGKWRGYTIKESKEIEELVKKADEERLRELRKMFQPLPLKKDEIIDDIENDGTPSP